MKVQLFDFQERALRALRDNAANALQSWQRTHMPQVLSLTAPTGAGKTIIMASLIEDILFGSEYHAEQPEAVFVWLSDSPQLNEHSLLKIMTRSDRIQPAQLCSIDETFDSELLADGRIYFLNTQRLSKSSRITREGDRNYTIWQTLANTVREKSNRLYVIIDEAHRGMQGGAEMGRATTIMQKFLKGSAADGLPAMPLVIGMSATIARFRKLAEGIAATTNYDVSAADVRDSGLLKERIFVHYPDSATLKTEMSMLRAAAEDWQDKCLRWRTYCEAQHDKRVAPVLIVQVEAGGKGSTSATALDECLHTIESATGERLEKGQVVHAFGEKGVLRINGLEVPYEEPAAIDGNPAVRVVLFKESLSTGWDCPRAETMMSFRRAKDATYIAQLLGRMIRTPLARRIETDETLNNVHLFLPHFETETVGSIVKALSDAEGGGDIADVCSEAIGSPDYETLTATPRPRPAAAASRTAGAFTTSAPATPAAPAPAPAPAAPQAAAHDLFAPPPAPENAAPAPAPMPVEEPVADSFDRAAVVRFINDAGLRTYQVRPKRIKSYLASLFGLAHLLTQCGVYPNAVDDMRSGVLNMLREHIARLKNGGQYEAQTAKVRQFKLLTMGFDIGGGGQNIQGELFEKVESDIARQFRAANAMLVGEGIGEAYGRMVYDENDPGADPLAWMVDVIIFAADEGCMESVHAWAKTQFHQLQDSYRRSIDAYANSGKSDAAEVRRQYEKIVMDGDAVSHYSLRLPERVQMRRDASGKEYATHLFVGEESGTARIRLNTWETGVVAEEEKRADFVCWIRNPARAAWALCIPYKDGTTDKPMYPDLIIVRHDSAGYVLDILEPHGGQFADNLAKAHALAEYARVGQHCVGRVQLIREMKNDVSGQPQFRRLDMGKSQVREMVLRATTSDALDALFNTPGMFD